jgi:Fe-S cluster assembly ATP-binding protein
MLSLRTITVNVADKTVLNSVSMDFVLGKNYCLLWKNWSWKSSLALTLMGHPAYALLDGEIILDGEPIHDLPPHERAQRGIFLAFQSIPEIPGVKLFEFLRTIYNTAHNVQESFVSFKKIIVPMVMDLSIDKDFLRRDLNVGFSGGERRKIEILQLKLLKPKYIILDEVDSGLDVDAFKAVAQLLQSLVSPDTTFIIVTHYFSVLTYVRVDEVFVLDAGCLVEHGGPEIIDRVQVEGFGRDDSLSP